MRYLSIAVLALGVACTPDSSQYVGSAMSDTSPDSAGALTLTLWPESDSAFGGYIRAGAPVRLAGWVYAWYEDGSLQISSITTDGDTVRWTSKVTDAAIGGRFRVKGITHGGSGGTWRANLQRGSAATVARLHSRRSEVWDEVVPTFLLLGVVFALARWVRREPWPPLPTPPAYPAFSSAPVGISGWLLLFTFGQIVVPLIGLARSWHTVFSPFSNNPLWDAHGVAWFVRPLIASEKLFPILHLALQPVGVVLIVRRSRFAPRFWAGFLITLATYLVLDAAVAQALAASLTDVVGREIGQGFALAASHATITNVRNAGFAIIWATYWCRSTRVRMTFGSVGLDRPVIEPPRVPTEPANPEPTTVTTAVEG